LLKKDVAWTWREEAQEAFNTLKEKLLEFPILKRHDFSKVLFYTLTGMLLILVLLLANLMRNARNMFITYSSKSNNNAKSNYSSYEWEYFVVVWVVIHFKLYLYGTKFTLYTDH
jgi:hypothetical protein